MSNPSRKLRRKIKKSHPLLQKDCTFWIDENDVPIEPEHAPEHDLECIFNGGLDSSSCFTCFLVSGAKHVWDAGRKTLTIHNDVDPGAEFVIIADPWLEKFESEPWAMLARGDGRKVAIFGPMADAPCSGSDCGAHGASA